MKRPGCYLILTILLFKGEVQSQDWHSAGDAERASIEKSLEKRLHSECGILDIVLVDSVLEPLDAESGGF